MCIAGSAQPAGMKPQKPVVYREARPGQNAFANLYDRRSNEQTGAFGLVRTSAQGVRERARTTATMLSAPGAAASATMLSAPGAAAPAPTTNPPRSETITDKPLTLQRPTRPAGSATRPTRL